ARAKAEDVWPDVARKECSLPKVAGPLALARCRARVMRNKIQKGLPNFRRYDDKRSTSNRLFESMHRAYRCKEACVRPRCSGEKIHAAPDRSAGQTPEYNGRDNRPGA